jgi:CheY-like chemotaxis protein
MQNLFDERFSGTIFLANRIKMTQPFSLIYIEDNAGDVQLLKLSFKSCLFAPELTVIDNSVRVLDWIKTCRASRVLPDLILLDLNLPGGTNGEEILVEIKTDPLLKKIPVMVFSGSGNQQDARKCLDLGADKYLSKPADFDRFLELGQFLKSWASEMKAESSSFI